MSHDTPFWTCAPTLKKAALYIAYDNGMINRHTPEDLYLADTERALTKYSVADVMAVERELAAMSDERLEEFCCGGSDGTRTGLADEMLDFVFEGGD